MLKHLLLPLILFNFFSLNATDSERKTDFNHSSNTLVNFNLPTDSSIIIPINSDDYDRYVLVKNTTLEYIERMTTEYAELDGTEGEFRMVEFRITESGDWLIIEVPEQIDFYAYHNLVGWYFGYEDHEDIPDFSVGLAKARNNPEDSYLFYLDPNNEFGDTHIGSFNNGTNFNIYLPEAYDVGGNITVNEHLPISYDVIHEYLTTVGFEMPDDDTPSNSFSVKEYSFENTSK
ncbi:MAG: hypothetical protein ACFHU9_12350 [Fluviicola sp.]